MEFNSLTAVKDKVTNLKGQSVQFEINKGRNKIVTLSAVIDQVYPSMFVIKPNGKVDLDRWSYSYNDVLCGDIKFL